MSQFYQIELAKNSYPRKGITFFNYGCILSSLRLKNPVQDNEITLVLQKQKLNCLFAELQTEMNSASSNCSRVTSLQKSATINAIVASLEGMPHPSLSKLSSSRHLP